MPIRTNRGRAAVYRRLWGFPMRSPSHLVGTVILVAAVLIAAGMLVPRLVGDSAGGGAGPVTPGAAGASSDEASPETDGGPSATLDREALPTRLSEPLATPSETEPAPEALRRAREWAEAWVTRPADGSAETWLDGLRPLTTPEFWPQLRSVEPDNITATEVVGEPEARQAHPKSVEVELTTDGPGLLVTVVDTDTGWRVSDYTETEE
ncbi:hypothetical protein B1813_18025 [Saccharomonospora piscinae]|uniref:Uncharacterized protein n=1 Tax=Saccharomonospora piscinae TaxID=687388 RepID=A0A1V8ZZU6_SACPI|nr:hypothetical protein [Saccharomonospora piscinae]OQO90318.1 hypothetical protein B1813_18025 [Saccharomonospora piscinae]TLW89734.1 hypothetical protein FFT09_22450 [Saccharomonospora piscinae]